MRKYCYNTIVRLENDGKTITGADMHPGKVMVIDTENLYMYDAKTNEINQIFSLDALSSVGGLDKMKSAIAQTLR